MSGQLRPKRPFYDGLRQLLQKTVLSCYVLSCLARRKQLVDQILLLLHTISCLSGMIVYTKLFTPSDAATPVSARAHPISQTSKAIARCTQSRRGSAAD